MKELPKGFIVEVSGDVGKSFWQIRCELCGTRWETASKKVTPDLVAMLSEHQAAHAAHDAN